MERVHFRKIRYADFVLARADRVPVGAVYYTLPSDKAEMAIDETRTKLNSIFVVTSGAWMHETRGDWPRRYELGDGASEWRKRTPYRCTAVEDDSSVVCLMPTDNTYWEREIINLGAGEEAAIPGDFDRHYLFICKGNADVDVGLTSQVTGIGENSMVRVTRGNARILKASTPLIAVRLWK